MRIVSLLSSATEIVYALGLEDSLVGISHECDYPPEALRLPRLSRSRFDPTGLDSGEIDRAVRRAMQEHGSVYEVDAAALARLRPDVILTQAVCEVCAVPTGSVEAAVAALPHRPEVVSLDAHTLEGIFLSVQQVADAAGAGEVGRRVVAELEGRVARAAAVLAGERRPRVLALEWLDPPFAPGHWVPQMITLAGGENLWGTAGAASRQGEWAELDALDPDVLLLLPCGFALPAAREDAERNHSELERVAERAIKQGEAWLGDAAYFSRSGPRVVEGIEALAAVLHPECFPDVAAAGRLVRWR